jgi:acid stress-induced BolA-like protein IbaG/YrbA
MKFKEKVRKVLEELELPGLEVEIEPGSGNRVVAEVVSDAFEGMYEHDRQDIVWRKLLDKLDDYEQTRVEFVHTTAPSERAEASNQ